MSLECFLAMAFGHDDTDDLYDKTIAPLLRKNRITPFRVDRSPRNEDIDDQILAGLQRCHLVIADLTYARPSVYYEAGVAYGRKVPVIFTCRSDHFKHRPDDSHGNFRVHFDLQMKPVVPWGTPGDARFLKRLTTRLDHVTRPLLKQKQTSALEQQRSAAFAALPLRGQLDRLESVYRTTLSGLGYKLAKNHHAGASVIPPRSRYLKWCDAHFFGSLSKTDLIAYGRLRDGLGFTATLEDLFEAGRLPRRATKHIVLYSLNRVSPGRVAAALPTSTINSEGHIVFAKHNTETELEKYPKTTKRSDSSRPMIAKIPTDTTVAVVSGLKHEGEFQKALEKILT